MGKKKKEGKKVYTLKLVTLKPEKYRVLDLDTGEVWQAILQEDGTIRWFTDSEMMEKVKKL